MDEVSFPVYRRLSNRRSFYKILSDLEFEEIQIMGSRRQLHQITANQYPEKLRIMDMIACIDGLFEVTDEGEWLANLPS